jgi:hypothetical protein
MASSQFNLIRLINSIHLLSSLPPEGLQVLSRKRQLHYLKLSSNKLFEIY